MRPVHQHVSIPAIAHFGNGPPTPALQFVGGAARLARIHLVGGAGAKQQRSKEEILLLPGFDAFSYSFQLGIRRRMPGYCHF